MFQEDRLKIKPKTSTECHGQFFKFQAQEIKNITYKLPNIPLHLKKSFLSEVKKYIAHSVFKLFKQHQQQKIQNIVYRKMPNLSWQPDNTEFF